MKLIAVLSSLLLKAESALVDILTGSNNLPRETVLKKGKEGKLNTKYDFKKWENRYLEIVSESLLYICCLLCSLLRKNKC